ncbi:MAG: hypothetical protein LUD47_02530 [Clostridia bacterium]|nr:hypothetical protein [Clostridia bacterium]
MTEKRKKSPKYATMELWWGLNDFPSVPREITLKPFMNFADKNGRSFMYRLSVEKV